MAFKTRIIMINYNKIIKFKIIPIIIITLIIGILASCANKPLDIKQQKIVVLLSGSSDDQNWNMINIEGIEACNADMVGLDIEYVENVKEIDFEKTMIDYASRGYDLIITAGNQFEEAAEAVATRYAATTFCVINGDGCDIANVVAVQIKEYEASYLAAIIAGSETTDGVFATIGGYPNDAMDELLDVYEKQAITVAESRGLSDARSMRAYANSWDDVELGSDITEQMISDGADMVFVYANRLGLGCIEAAAKYHAKIIGFSSDQTIINPDVVIASVVFDFQKLYNCILNDYSSGHIRDDRLRQVGMDSDMFYVVYTDHVSDHTKAMVSEAIEQSKLTPISLIKE